MAWPGLVVMLMQTSVGLIETYWIADLGAEALSGMVLVFPAWMLMQMLSAGAVGGGVSSAIARALGSGRRSDADALVLHGLVVHAAIGLGFSVVFLVFGEAFYRLLGGRDASLAAALAYSNVVFSGNAILWIMNAFASVIRGTGNMRAPSASICAGVALLVPLSPLLIYGGGPVPAMGMVGAGAAVLIATLFSTALLGWHLLGGRCVVRLVLCPIRWAFVREILGVGAVSAINATLTTLAVVVTTALIGTGAGAEAIAGYGMGSRLEYLLIPLMFGIGAPLVSLVGTNFGAGRRDRALRSAIVGAALGFALAETVGLLAATFPVTWLSLFSFDPLMLSAGTDYLQIVGPTYGFFGAGLCLYFASQGIGRVAPALFAGALRTFVAAVGGWTTFALTGSISLVFVMVAAGNVLYGGLLVVALGMSGEFRVPMVHRQDQASAVAR